MFSMENILCKKGENTMMHMNLQFFGGRGAAAAKRSSGSNSDIEQTSNGSWRMKNEEYYSQGVKLNNDTQKMMDAWQKAIPEGTYEDPTGETMEIQYASPNELAVNMYVDGRLSAKMYQQYSGEWRIEDYSTGDFNVYSTPLKAARSLKDSLGDYKRKRK